MEDKPFQGCYCLCKDTNSQASHNFGTKTAAQDKLLLPMQRY